ncbi:MAG: MFS transporter [Lachnospiraceae bacterium]|nr:MFS transporter [Lachnospiraceae bacterium]
MKEKKTVWTADFTRITLASILSIIGGEALNLPMSLLVYDQTESTFLSSLIMVFGMLPDIVLSVVVSPVIDRTSKKKWIVGLDVLFALTYAAMAFATFMLPFYYGLYVLFTLVTSTLSVFYRLAYDAWYPDLIPKGLEQKGFAVSGMVMDATVVIMAPVSAFLYLLVPIWLLFAFVAVTIVIAIAIEAGIKEVRHAPEKTEGKGLRAYLADLKAGFGYLKKEHGVRNIFTYMSVSIGTGDGRYILERTYYQTTAGLGVARYGFLASAATAARVLSGLVLYKKEVPPKKRFGVVRFVYTSLNVLSAALLFLPFPLALVDMALEGGLSNTSYTLRQTATKAYIPADMRARLGAIFNMMISISGIGFTLLAGALGEVLPLRTGVILFCVIDLAVMALFICLPARHNRVVYEAERKDEE